MGDWRREITSRICASVASLYSADMTKFRETSCRRRDGGGTEARRGAVGEGLRGRAARSLARCRLTRRAPLTSSFSTFSTSSTTTLQTTAMSDNFAVAATSQAHDADVEFFVRRGMTKGYQLLSLLTPPVYTVFALTRYGRSHISVNRLLRATWIGGSAGMCVLLDCGARPYKRGLQASLVEELSSTFAQRILTERRSESAGCTRHTTYVYATAPHKRTC